MSVDLRSGSWDGVGVWQRSPGPETGEAKGRGRPGGGGGSSAWVVPECPAVSGEALLHQESLVASPTPSGPGRAVW